MPDELHAAVATPPGPDAIPPGPSSARYTPTTPPPSGSPWLAALAELLGGVPVVGKFIKVLIDKRMWGPLVLTAALLLFFVAYPLLVPFLAAYWTNKGLLFGVRDTYVDEVRAAFRVREAADDATTESYKRLDYFIPIEFSRRARDGKAFELPLMPMQKVELRISPGRLSSVDPERCGIPAALLGEGVDLMEILLNDIRVGRVQNQGEPRNILLTKETWAGFKGLGDAQSMQLSFKPVAELRSACEQLQVEIKASVLVFKDVYKP